MSVKRSLPTIALDGSDPQRQHRNVCRLEVFEEGIGWAAAPVDKAQSIPRKKRII